MISCLFLALKILFDASSLLTVLRRYTFHLKDQMYSFSSGERKLNKHLKHGCFKKYFMSFPRYARCIYINSIK